MPSANVHSLDAIRRMRLALQTFQIGAFDGLAAVQLEIQRAIDWIEHDRPKHWEERVRKGWENIATARANLERCEMQIVAGHTPECRDEKIALARAKAELRHAEEMIDVVKHWQRTISHETSEYAARMSQINGWLEGDCPRAIAALGKMVQALEEYLATQAPTGSDLAETTPSMARSGDETGKPIEPPVHVPPTPERVTES